MLEGIADSSLSPSTWCMLGEPLEEGGCKEASKGRLCTAGRAGRMHPEPPHPQHQQRALRPDHSSAEAGALLRMPTPDAAFPMHRQKIDFLDASGNARPMLESFILPCLPRCCNLTGCYLAVADEAMLYGTPSTCRHLLTRQEKQAETGRAEIAVFWPMQ